MEEVDINTLLEYNNYYYDEDQYYLNKNIPNNIIIVGEIFKLNIRHKYDKLDLSRVDCYELNYYRQESDSIENHILPNSLKELECSFNRLTSLPDLPDSLQMLECSYNNLRSFTNVQLPDSLECLYCVSNKLSSFGDNQLPNSLKILDCSGNKLTSLPDFSNIDHELILRFYQDLPINYIPYNTNIKLNTIEDNKIIIEGYPHNPITNQKELDQYMDYQFHKMNRVKSARK